MDKIIFHIDVNSAFLSWSAVSALENGQDEDLRLIPAIVGGDSSKRHGIVLAKSVPAKAYGIETGEPVANAFRKCPFLKMVSPDFTIYKEKSHAFIAYLSGLCPEIEQVSIDECYMDFTPIAHLYSSPHEAAVIIKDTIREKFGFTVNIGISDKKVLAKMASDFQKPDKVHTLFSYEIRDKMWPLPVSSLYMCGKSSVEALKKLEILTIGDLANTDPSIIEAHLKSLGLLLHNYANGIDDSVVEPEPVKRKGVGNSTTLSHDLTTREEAGHTLLELAESVGTRLRKEKDLAGVICIEIKYNTFKSVSHQMALYTPTSSTDALYKAAMTLFDALWDHTPIRLLGLRTSKLVNEDAPVQLSLFDMMDAKPVSEKQQKLNAALDQIRNRYGSDSVKRGSMLSPDK